MLVSRWPGFLRCASVPWYLVPTRSGVHIGNAQRCAYWHPLVCFLLAITCFENSYMCTVFFEHMGCIGSTFCVIRLALTSTGLSKRRIASANFLCHHVCHRNAGILAFTTAYFECAYAQASRMKTSARAYIRETCTNCRSFFRTNNLKLDSVRFPCSHSIRERTRMRGADGRAAVRLIFVHARLLAHK